MTKRKLTKQEKRRVREQSQRKEQTIRDETNRWLGQFSGPVRDHLLEQLAIGLDKHDAAKSMPAQQ